MKVRIRVDGDVKELQVRTRKRLREALKETAWRMYAYTVDTYLTGGKGVKVRSGTLRRSTMPVYDERRGRFIAGVSFGVKYAVAHVGKPGTFFEVRPRHAKFLAIPTKYARTPAGVSRYSSPLALSDTFIRGGVIYQRQGRRAVPMFILRRSVRIPRRIDSEDILQQGVKYLEEVL